MESGKIYKGEWKNGKQHGFGEMWLTDDPDNVTKGEWENGRRINKDDFL